MNIRQHRMVVFRGVSGILPDYKLGGLSESWLLNFGEMYF